MNQISEPGGVVCCDYLPGGDRKKKKEGGRNRYKTGGGCGRRRQGEGPVTAETASIDLARLAGEPLTVGKEVSLGEPGNTSWEDS